MGRHRRKFLCDGNLTPLKITSISEMSCSIICMLLVSSQPCAVPLFGVLCLNTSFRAPRLDHSSCVRRTEQHHRPLPDEVTDCRHRSQICGTYTLDLKTIVTCRPVTARVLPPLASRLLSCDARCAGLFPFPSSPPGRGVCSAIYIALNGLCLFFLLLFSGPIAYPFSHTFHSLSYLPRSSVRTIARLHLISLSMYVFLHYASHHPFISLEY